MKYLITLNGKRYEVEVEKGQAMAVYTGEAKTNNMIPSSSPIPVSSKPMITKVANIGVGERVSAPMPGTILEVKCEKGQHVKGGDVLFILEAMKMENEVTSPKDGIITGIYIGKGSKVETGSVLCTLE